MLFILLFIHNLSSENLAFPVLVSWNSTADQGKTCQLLSSSNSSIWWNPALSARNNYNRISFNYRNWILNINEGSISQDILFKRWGISYLAFYSFTRVERWSKNNIKTGTVNPQELIIQTTSFYSITRNIHIGIGGKFFYHYLIETQGVGGGLDMGILLTGIKFIEIGLSGRNIINGIKYRNRFLHTPGIVSAGIMTQLNKMKIGMGIDYINDQGICAGIGLATPVEFLEVNSGWRYEPQVYGVKSMGSFSLGFGVTYKDIETRYLMEILPHLGLIHNLLISKNIGKRPPYSHLTIIVKDSLTDKPIKADIKIKKGEIVKKFLNKKRVSLNFLDPGSLYINVKKKDYFQKEKVVELKPYETKREIIYLNFIPYGEIEGIITNKENGEPIPSEIYLNGRKKYYTQNDKLTGEYRIDSIIPGQYILRVVPIEKTAHGKSIRVKIEPGKKLIKDIELVGMEKTKLILTLHINFETGKDKIIKEYYPILDSIAPMIISLIKEGRKIEISGHTDNVPIKYAHFKDNKELSLARARAVKRYFVKKYNLPEDMFICKGYGAEKPIASNDTPEGRAMNRRVEFRIIE